MGDIKIQSQDILFETTDIPALQSCFDTPPSKWEQVLMALEYYGGTQTLTKLKDVFAAQPEVADYEKIIDAINFRHGNLLDAHGRITEFTNRSGELLFHYKVEQPADVNSTDGPVFVVTAVTPLK